MQRGIIEAWTIADYVEMGVERAFTERHLLFTSRILPLADDYPRYEAQTRSACERIMATWGEDWEEQLGDLLPGFPTETFLRGLAVYVEEILDQRQN